MTSDEMAVRDSHARWIAAVNANDLAYLLTAIADDAVLLSPGRAPSGRDDFTAEFSAAHGALRLHCRSDIEEVGVCNDLAWTRCRDTLTITPRASGATQRFEGHRLTLYRRAADGRWLLTRDAHTLTLIADS